MQVGAITVQAAMPSTGRPVRGFRDVTVALSTRHKIVLVIPRSGERRVTQRNARAPALFARVFQLHLPSRFFPAGPDDPQIAPALTIAFVTPRLRNLSMAQSTA